MKRVILDTNIYGLIAVDAEREDIRKGLARQIFVIYGNSVIRKQLRNTRRGFVDGINLRADLMRLYHEITKDRELEIRKRELEVADNYYATYRKLGGITSKDKMHADFLILASASVHNLDIVASDDKATMFNEISTKAVQIVNSSLKLNTPRFIGYEEFKRNISV